jgi:hypothetical protein
MDPQGWSVLVGKDKLGFFDVLVSHGNEAWQVKEYQVNPYKFVGLGSRLSNLPQNPISSNTYSFGLRPVGVDIMKELSNIMDDPISMSELASRVLAQKPVSAREAAESPGVLHGPILQSSRPLEPLSTAQTSLDEKLRRELRRIVQSEFRHTLTPYV